MSVVLSTRKVHSVKARGEGSSEESYVCDGDLYVLGGQCMDSVCMFSPSPPQTVCKVILLLNVLSYCVDY